jgi:hypothetical protein
LDLKSAISALFSGRNERFCLGNDRHASKLTAERCNAHDFWRYHFAVS